MSEEPEQKKEEIPAITGTLNMVLDLKLFQYRQEAPPPPTEEHQD